MDRKDGTYAFLFEWWFAWFVNLGYWSYYAISDKVAWFILSLSISFSLLLFLFYGLRLRFAKQIKLIYASLTPEIRGFYQNCHGFDPLSSYVLLQFSQLRYEEYFPLQADPTLKAAGIKIGARVDVEFPNGTAHNRIIFKKGRKEAPVKCVHTVLYQGDVMESNSFTSDSAEKIISGARTPPSTAGPR
ncbi:MAG TPA: hypothetical protein VKK79_09955, partial [Candidatus Lokiarchaeia archaeon]|nr:hypothetical protein [Candidatus Lokiarchaeia archaeon]